MSEQNERAAYVAELEALRAAERAEVEQLKAAFIRKNQRTRCSEMGALLGWLRGQRR
jgi:hypothetical protein